MDYIEPKNLVKKYVLGENSLDENAVGKSLQFTINRLLIYDMFLKQKIFHFLK